MHTFNLNFDYYVWKGVNISQCCMTIVYETRITLDELHTYIQIYIYDL